MIAPESITTTLVGDIHHQRHVVLDDQHGNAQLRASRAAVCEFLRFGVVEPGRRLVEQQQLAAAPSTRARPPAAFARPSAIRSRASRRSLTGPPVPASPPRGGAAAALRRARRRATASGSDNEWRPRRWPPTITFSIAVMPGNTRADWKVRIRPRPAIFTADRPARSRPAEADFPCVARHDVGDEVEDRGFAGAVRTDQRGDLMRLRIERHVVDGFEAAEAFGEAAHAQDRAFNWAGLRSIAVMMPAPRLDRVRLRRHMQRAVAEPRQDLVDAP